MIDEIGNYFICAVEIFLMVLVLFGTGYIAAAVFDFTPVHIGACLVCLGCGHAIGKYTVQP